MVAMSFVLPQAFYTSDDVVTIARSLLGKVVVTQKEQTRTSGMIVETEAYRSPDDRACHAFNDKVTPRTRTMFENGGRAYVYICYGVHRMLNVVTSSQGQAHAVLIRAVEPLEGQSTMALRRGQKMTTKETVNGPGKLCQALGISAEMDGCLLYTGIDGIWIEDRKISVLPQQILAGPRVGLSKLTGPDAHRPWRFTIQNNKYVSYPKVVTYPEAWKLL